MTDGLKMVVSDDVLKIKLCKPEEKEEAYAALLNYIKDNTVNSDDEVNKNKATMQYYRTELLKCACRDLHLRDEKIALNALQALHWCLRDGQTESFQKSESEQALNALFRCAKQAQSMEVINLVLNCFIDQSCHPDALISQLSALLSCVEEVNSLLSPTDVGRIVDIFVRLDEQIPENLKASAPRWARLVLPGITSSTVGVKEKSLSLLEKYEKELNVAQDFRKHAVKAINAGLAQSLKNLTASSEAYVMKAWAFIVRLVGKELHKGSSINALLEIIEISFKGSGEARLNAFIAWRSLIDNFELDKAVISDPKRIKLLMMVLKIDNAKTEAVAIEKLQTWWHFIRCIGPKLLMNFEQIVYPLLHFCVGNGKLNTLMEHGQSPRLALKASASNSPAGLVPSSRRPSQQLPVFPGLQKLGFEVLAHLLVKAGNKDDLGLSTWKLAPLPDECFGSLVFFVKHAPVILSAFHELLRSIGKEVEEAVVLHIWTSLGNHLKEALESSVKTECRDVYSTFLAVLHSVTQDQMLPKQTIMKMMHTCCSFPIKVLASTAYSLTGGQTVRAQNSQLLSAQGCPALLLSEILITPYMMEGLTMSDSFIKLFSTLANAGASNPQGALLFLQTITDMLDTHAYSLASPELLWRMWNIVAHILQDSIDTTNEVNQGDALEHNFDCMYSVLLLPIKHQMSSRASSALCKAALKTWKELYHSFARLSALVATAEANICLEEMSSKIMSSWKPEFKDPVNLEFMSSVCQKMVECVDFSALQTHQSPGGGLTLSPAKWVRRRQRPMGNLHSFIHLLTTLQTEMNNHLPSADGFLNTQKQDSTAVSITFIGHTLVEVYTKIFSHITTTTLISSCLASLAGPMARLYHGNSKSGPSKLFMPSFLAKLEKLWQEIAHCITGRYTGQYDSEFLANVAPLLEATFIHSRRAIRNQTMTLWSTTFGRTSTLEYPKSLKPVLATLKEKNAIILPGWITGDEAVVIAETPFSEMSMGESQAPAPILPGMPSPKRQRGSILNQDVSPVRKLSPKPKGSPVKVVSPKKTRNLFSWGSKKINVDFLPEEDFVVIDSPATKKKRLLTEHQKEVLKEKCVLPAMYNNLDASQDISLMSHFGTDTQQNSISSAEVIVIESSETQDDSSHRKSQAKDVNDCVEKTSTLSESFPTPLLPRTAPKRSVRIQELHNSDEIEDIVSNADHQSPCDLLTDKHKATQNPTMEQEGIKQSTDTNEYDVKATQGKTECTQNSSEDDLVKSSVETDSLNNQAKSNTECDPTKDCTETTEDVKKMDAPFVMFRTRSGSDHVDDKHKISASQGSTPTKPRRISLRKVRSQDDVLFTTSEKTKMPRRVPLKKINEQDHGLDSETSKGRPLSGEKSQDSSLSPKLDKWLIRSDQSKNNSKGKKKQSIALTSEVTSPETMQVTDTETIVHVSCTLVEDTQSPMKTLKQVANSGHTSIAETPTKGGDCHSTPVKALSARKLFVEGDSVSTLTPSMKTQLDQVVTNSSDKGDSKETAGDLVPEDSILTSSQGFEMSWETVRKQAEGQQTMSELSQVGSQKDSTEAKSRTVNDINIQSKILPRSSDMPDSENLFPNSQDTPAFSLEIMPTMASPSKLLQKFSQTNSSKSTSSESNKTSSSSDEAANKQNGSSESDFNPSQPTLREDDTKNSSNKRKTRRPRKLTEVTCRQRKRVGRAAKKCPCCRSPSTSDIRETDKSAAECNKPAENKKEKCKPASSPTDHSLVSTDKSAEDQSIPEQDAQGFDGSSQEPVVVLTKVKSRNGPSPEIGEVTPDVKSPSNATPQRRHRAVKRRGRLGRADPGKSGAKKSFVLKGDDKEEADSHELAKSLQTGRKRKHRNDNCEVEMESTPKSVEEKRKTPSPASRKYSKSKLVLRTRSNTARRISPNDHLLPPIKMRRKMREDQEMVNENEPLCALKRKQDLKRADTELEKNKTPTSAKENEMSHLLKKNETPYLPSGTETPCLSRESAVAAVKGFQRPEIIDLTDGDSNESRLNTERNSRMVDAALSTALSQLLSASLVSKGEVIEEDTTAEGLSSSTPSDVMTASEQEAPVSISCSEVSQDHLQPGQKVTCIEDEHSEVQVTHDSACVHVEGEALMDASAELGNGQEVGELASQENSVDRKSLGEAEGGPESLYAGKIVEGSTQGDDDEMEITPQQDDDSNLPNAGMEADHASLSQSAVANKEQQEVSATVPLTGCEDVAKGSEITKDAAAVDQEEPAVSDQSHVRSPSCSILKRPAQETPPSSKNRRVSFAEPVVSGESPVRENYCDSIIPTSPLAAPCTDSPKRKASLFVKSMQRAAGYRRRLESSPRKDPSWSRLARNGVSSSVSSQSQSYKPTQESQLDSTGPIFPELVDCKKPLDDILPQLTSSLWYRGLCQLMKGRNLNTIGDLSLLTEVQVDQLPIRHPKVQTVKTTLSTYMAQHGLGKAPIATEELTDSCKSPGSVGATTEQEVTPSSIADEGVTVHGSADQDLQKLSPIKDVDNEKIDNKATTHRMSEERRGPLHGKDNSRRLSLSQRLEEDINSADLKNMTSTELMDILQTLTNLSGKVVEEMKVRQPQK